MATINIDRILETCIKKGASEVHLFVGSPPMLRLHGNLCELKTASLNSENCVALMKSITPNRNQQDLLESGNTSFGFAFGDAGHFHVSAFNRNGNISIALRHDQDTRNSKLGTRY